MSALLICCKDSMDYISKLLCIVMNIHYLLIIGKLSDFLFLTYLHVLCSENHVIKSVWTFLYTTASAHEFEKLEVDEVLMGP